VFDARIARYVKERVWHASQQAVNQEDGSVVVTLQVANDFALRSWILGFGALARVVAPPELEAQILEELEQARQRYRTADQRAGS
jgi:predicted DNA-binding transcriptional regulator YafY